MFDELTFSIYSAASRRIDTTRTKNLFSGASKFALYHFGALAVADFSEDHTAPTAHKDGRHFQGPTRRRQEVPDAG